MVDVLDMQVGDFFETKFVVTQYILNQMGPRPCIENMRKICFEKVSFDLRYSDSMNSNELLACCLFSKKQKKIIETDSFSLDQNLKWQKTPKGIEGERKRSLLSKIFPVVPDNKRDFFKNMLTKEVS